MNRIEKPSLVIGFNRYWYEPYLEPDADHDLAYAYWLLNSAQKRTHILCRERKPKEHLLHAIRYPQWGIEKWELTDNGGFLYLITDGRWW